MKRYALHADAIGDVPPLGAELAWRDRVAVEIGREHQRVRIQLVETERDKLLEEKKRSIPGAVEPETELEDARTAESETRKALLRFRAATFAGLAAALEYLGHLADRCDLHVEDDDGAAIVVKAAHGALGRLAA